MKLFVPKINLAQVLKIAAPGLVACMLLGCAVTAVDPGAASVHVISEVQAKACRFVDSVSTNSGNTLSEHPEQEARNRAFNRVAAQGGNALRIVSTNTQASPSGIGSMFYLTGEAYACK